MLTREEPTGTSSLYGELASALHLDECAGPGPGTIETSAIETSDNDRAMALLGPLISGWTTPCV